MKQYISKSALAAEIKKIKSHIGSDKYLSDYEKGCNFGREDVCDSLLNFIDTLEVKDIDIRSEVSNWWNNHYTGIKKDYTFEGYSGHYLDNSTIVNLAQYFYGLGLKSQQP